MQQLPIHWYEYEIPKHIEIGHMHAAMISIFVSQATEINGGLEDDCYSWGMILSQGMF